MSDAAFPSSVLFCCDYNSIRSPMAEGLMKKLYGTKAYVQSAGVKHDLEIDGFAVAVCGEMGIALERHRARSFDEMQEWGDDLSGFDLIVALSPASQRRALDLTEHYHLDVEYWQVSDPAGNHSDREAGLAAYRQTRDQLVERLVARFGPPVEEFALTPPQPAIPSPRKGYAEAVAALKGKIAALQDLVDPIAKRDARRGHNRPPTPMERPWIDWIELNDTLLQTNAHLDLTHQHAGTLERLADTFSSALSELTAWAVRRRTQGTAAVFEVAGVAALASVSVSAADILDRLSAVLSAIRKVLEGLRP